MKRNFVACILFPFLLHQPISAQAGPIAEARCNLFKSDITAQNKAPNRIISGTWTINRGAGSWGSTFSADIANLSRTHRILELEIELAGSLNGLPFRRKYQADVSIDPEFVGAAIFDTNLSYYQGDELELEYWKITKIVGCEWD